MIDPTDKEIDAMTEETAKKIEDSNEARPEYGCKELKNEAA